MTKRSDPWFKCFPSDWIEATRSLTPEQRGIYFDCLCLIYQFGKPLPDDDKWMSHQLHISTRLWRSVRDALVAAGKLVKTDEGYTNERAEFELDSRSKQARTNAEIAANRERTKRENSKKDNKISEAPARNEHHARALQISDNRNIDNNPPTPLAGDPTPLDALVAFELWNETALRCGLPQAAKLTNDRKRKIRARLKDYGLDGWRRALANIERSSFLTGNNDRNWRADIDFLLKPSSFSKVHDGGYGNGRHAEPKPKIEYLDADWIREARAAMDY